MKKWVKILLVITAIFIVLCLSGIITVFALTSGVKLDESKLMTFDNTVEYYNANGNEITEEFANISVTKSSEIPTHVKNAFIAIEDKRFYSHKGVDYKGLIRATFNNFKSFSFKEGASTISQQLIKNTHFNSEKTIKRKLAEIKLAKKLEKKYSKEEILEKYLNTIYFGDNCFGITKAAEYYFAKSPSDLDVAEGAMLAGIIKAPSYYSPFYDAEKCTLRRNTVLKAMLDQGYISNNQYDKYSTQELPTCCNQSLGENSAYLSLAKKELTDVFEKIKYSAKKYKVYLNLDKEKQKILSQNVKQGFNNNYSSIITDKNGKIVAYESNVGDIPRQVGSTIKPLLVYAPIVEENLADSSTFILDEPIEFSGYSPSNYNDKYYGYVTVKESLAKSLNCCSVKLLNTIGIEKAKVYVNKMGFNLSDNDNSLCLALGATENGINFSKLCSAYSVFMNAGTYLDNSCINKITDENGRILYKNNLKKTKIFSDDTTEIVNDMLFYTAKEGTAKKLNENGIELCAKTGTVGSEKGNTDAYCISYNSEYCLGVWMGNKDGSLLDNSITGGTYPTINSKVIWNNLYNGTTSPKAYEKSNNTVTVKLDRISFENYKIELADKNTPDRYKIDGIFRKSRVPKVVSSRFIYPKIENPKLSVKNNGITVSLCVTELIDFYIYREENGKKVLVYDSKTNGKNKEYFDEDILVNHEYVYSIIPYFETDGILNLGEEFVFEKIKILPPNINSDWWQNDEFS